MTGRAVYFCKYAQLSAGMCLILFLNPKENIIGIERYYDFDVLQNAENYFTKVFQTLNKILEDLSAKNKQKKTY